MKEIIARFTNPSPSFFVKIQKIGISMLSIGGAILAPSTLGITLPAGFIMPTVLTTLAAHLITAGGIAVFIGKLPVEDPSVLPNKEQPKDAAK